MPRSTPDWSRRHLLANGVSYFNLIESSGTLEVAPSMGFADIIGDITESGATIRENRLKQIDGGTAITSQACVIARRMSPDRDSKPRSHRAPASGDDGSSSQRQEVSLA